DLLARGRRDLQERYPRATGRVLGEEAAECRETLRQALRVIEPIHADRERSAFEARTQALGGCESHGGFRLARDDFGIDADRERRGAECAPAVGDETVAANARALLVARVIAECTQVVAGLESNQVAGGEGFHEGAV